MHASYAPHSNDFLKRKFTKLFSMALKPALSKCSYEDFSCFQLKPKAGIHISHQEPQDFTKELDQSLLTKGHTVLIDVRTMQLYPYSCILILLYKMCCEYWFGHNSCYWLVWADDMFPKWCNCLSSRDSSLGFQPCEVTTSECKYEHPECFLNKSLSLKIIIISI